ncbi:acyl-CoA thioesterase [Gordonia paraffinivorans]|uniref:Acyl-ACP thioesterase n=1 Tax=Gordonia paraffinivorans TaxID=175628 RepID=A0ABD7UYA9_9ACTN|nr:thioesterase family protein [Gordonia paraffinivorans]MCD2144669.1 acyl-CoA thioesterase [Gordonia paraffinivorans]PWD41727.1 thioesterase [Gordonia paraffinivorans]VFA81489.1 Acyl-ACP thioesterase [Gordonia paraffinivorans]
MASESAAADYSLEIPIHLRWGDMDINNHINNVQIARLFEEARVRSFHTWIADAPRNFSFLVVRQDIEFHAPVHYSTHPVTVTSCVGRVGNSSFTMALRLFDKEGVHCASAETTMVVVDPVAGRPAPIQSPLREVLTNSLGRPVEFGGRRGSAG